jgi:hypothetical protein
MDLLNSTSANSPTIRDTRRSISRLSRIPISPTNHTVIQLREWNQHLASHLLEAKYNYRSSHLSELQHAHSVIQDFAGTATYDIPAYVTDVSILKAVTGPLNWFSELPADVQSLKLEEGRAMYSLWAEAVAWINHAPTGTVCATAIPDPAADMSSLLDAIGTAMSTASLSMIGVGYPKSDGDATTTMESTSTATATATAASTSDDGAHPGFVNSARKEMAGVAVGMIVGVAAITVVLL